VRKAKNYILKRTYCTSQVQQSD